MKKLDDLGEWVQKTQRQKTQLTKDPIDKRPTGTKDPIDKRPNDKRPNDKRPKDKRPTVTKDPMTKDPPGQKTQFSRKKTQFYKAPSSSKNTKNHIFAYLSLSLGRFLLSLFQIDSKT